MKREIERIRGASEQVLPELPLCSPQINMDDISFLAKETKQSYIKKVNKIKSYIAQGDIYQACFTYPITTSIDDPFTLYRLLRQINPAPFSSYIQFGNLSILSTSPERFVKLDSKRCLESRPIKGTRPRSSDAKLDQITIEDLVSSEKDRAENLMIVDLVRNDFGKVCMTGQVWVPDLLQVESYATVHQLVSTVRGKLLPEIKIMEAIKAVFPGGSMTGAPKIRAMELLNELENERRGIYSGGLGYLDVRGNFDLSMVIRTIICCSRQALLHVGGGIVTDSDPEKEYQETRDKAYALKKAILQVKNSYVH
jgi:aminodeoxychorismate synthase component I